MSYKTVKKTIDFCEKHPLKSDSLFIIIFVVLMKNRKSSENVPRMKVLKICKLDVLPYLLLRTLRHNI